MQNEDITWEDEMDWESFQESSDACLVSDTFAEESGAVDRRCSQVLIWRDILRGLQA